MSVLLVFPPFALPRTPHLAVPTLAAYLRKQGLQVTAIDANIELYHHLLTQERIDEGRAFSEDRIRELDAKKNLNHHEREEYLRLYLTLLFPRHAANAELIFGHERSFSKLLSAFHAAVLNINALFFPETIEVQPVSYFIQYKSPFNKFSTRDILKSTESEGMLSGFFEKLLQPVLIKEQPVVAGISICFEDQVHAAFRCAKVIRALSPHTHITIGGTFVAASMSGISEEHNHLFETIDSLIPEDGEIPLTRLVQEISSPRPDLSSVPGLVYLDGPNIRRSSPPKLIDFESLPAPDYRSFPLDRYIIPRKIMGLPIRSSRGCYWRRCVFCRTESSVIRDHQQASADYIYDTITKAAEETGVRLFNFTDDAALPNVLAGFANKLISNKDRLHWTTTLRLDTSITLERALIFKKSGCTNMHFGLETYNDRLLALADKGTTVKAIDRILSNISWANIYVLVYMMVGFPTETEEEAVQTYKVIKELQSNGMINKYMYHGLQILPGSRYYREPEKYGIRNIRIPEGQDLPAAIHDFEVDGMSRSTAGRLALEFNLNGPVCFNQDVSFDDRTMTLRHDLNRIFNEISDRSPHPL